VTQVVFGSLK